MAYARNFNKSFELDTETGLIEVGGTSPNGGLHDARLLARHVAVLQGEAYAAGGTDLGQDDWGGPIEVLEGSFSIYDPATAIGTELYEADGDQNPGAFATPISFTWYSKVELTEGTVKPLNKRP